MDRVLVVSGTEKGHRFFAELMAAHGDYRLRGAGSGAEARRILAEDSFDQVIVNAPLPDEFGHDLALRAAEATAAGVILVVRGELADEVAARVEDFGVFVIAKPISRALFYQALRLTQAAHKRVMGLRTENEKLQVKIEEIRLVDRAKCVLIQVLGFTESEAHHYIEKQAMDLRLPRREIAERILRTYES
ncbi:ANTAR domain-containing response regulator [Gehongia tenuis]|uniref:Response regulator n=1 Tax=Gehongia tenuis TaxID=2763655 RepID=A0A926D403_9FIRM|nr:ANTAR domain-containing protein [Gehongia tenuis]MBC8530489.1 response regulator [Gehongia tenuis]